METTRERTALMVQRGTLPRTKWLSPHWLVLAISLVMQASALAGYQFARIDAANPDMTYPLGVNNSGQIVGTIYDDEGHRHGFQMDLLGGYGAIDFPGATDSQAIGINPDGLIVGGYFDGSHTHGFLFNGGGDPTIGAADVGDAQPSGLNRVGQ